MLQETRPVRPCDHLAMLFGREAGGDEVLGLPRVVEDRDQAVAGSAERARAVDDFVQNGVDVEARADAQYGRAQPRDAVPRRLLFAPRLVGVLQWRTLLKSGANAASTPPRLGSIDEPGSDCAASPMSMITICKFPGVTKKSPNHANYLCGSHERQSIICVAVLRHDQHLSERPVRRIADAGQRRAALREKKRSCWS